MRVVQAGNMSTLNCPEEVYLAEKLVAMHPWSGMARFTRSGGEACAVAVRIARAYSGKSAVAFCGYHGWHDWYLSANLSEDSALDGHLLPGLLPAGVPRGLAGTARPFEYNDLGTLQTIMDADDVGVIFMEVRRGTEPNPGFLEGVRAIADKKNAVLIFDECTSGFRKTFGGLHLDYGVNPDITVLGKTLGNGYAINAILGSTQVMQAAQDTFISSTFWTERIGPAAALATLAVMEEEDAPARIHDIGLSVQIMWKEIGHSVGLKVLPVGVPSLSTFSIEGFDPIVTKTFITQEMLKKGFIAGTALYSSIAHEKPILDQYRSEFEKVLTRIANFNSSDEITALLEGGASQAGFQRLT
jgi:glutamate-1-semialdehyde 2,1-aminomutase